MKRTLVVIALGFTAHAYAAEIGTAGCGLGNQIFGASDSQILASTTNGLSGTQTFGITSGTSNCTDSSGMAKLEAYVEANKLALANDVARGSGQTLSGLSEVLGCRNASEVNQVLHRNYENIFSHDGSDAVSARIRSVLKNKSVVACERLS